MINMIWGKEGLLHDCQQKGLAEKDFTEKGL